MANTRYNTDAIKKRGGKVIAIRRVNSDTTPIANETWFDLGSKSSTDVDISRAKSPINDEAGDPVAYDVEPWKGEVKVTLLQTDANTLNFLLKETENQDFAAIVHCGLGSGTATEYMYCPFVEFDQGFKTNFKDRTVDVMMRTKIPNVAWNANSLTAANASTTGWSANFGASNPASLSGSLTGNGNHIAVLGEV